jgi:hypothetical protein
MLDPAYQSYAHRHHTYLSRGHYAEQLEGLYGLFGPERVLVLQSEAMFADPDATLQGVFRFLGLEAATLGPLPVYKAGREREMPAAVRTRLEAYYAGPTEHFYSLPSVNFRWDPRD